MSDISREDAIAEALGQLVSQNLVRSILKRTEDGKLVKVTIRPVELKGKRYVQVSSFDGRKTVAKNYITEDFPSVANELLDPRLSSVTVMCKTSEFTLTFSRKGRPLLVKRTVGEPPEIALGHDRALARLLPEGTPDPFLQGIGLMTPDGRIKADKQRKFRQINEFLRLVAEKLLLGKERINSDSDGLLIVDFGCGQAYLTLALSYYLNEKLGFKTELVGVDRSAELIRSGENKAALLGRERICFVASSISEYVPTRTPDIVVALHACDTATDDALAKAITSRAKSIFVAPCCHRHLHLQLVSAKLGLAEAALLSEPIVRERIGDVLTDVCRALLLRISGYAVDMIEFTSPEHTPRNLMIRATLLEGAISNEAADEYQAIKERYGIKPFLEKLLSDSKNP